MDTEGMEEQIQERDEQLFKAIDGIRNHNNTRDISRPEYFKQIVGLPIRMGGLGCTRHAQIREAARNASKQQSIEFLRSRGLLRRDAPPTADNITVQPHGQQHSTTAQLDPPNQPPVVPPDPPPPVQQHGIINQKTATQQIHQETQENMLRMMNDEQKLCYVDQTSKVGNLWLTAVPYGQFRVISDQQFAGALQIKLLHSPLPANETCTFCGQGPEQVNRTHFERCSRCAHHIYTWRHNGIRDTVKDAVQRAGYPTELEPHVGEQPRRKRADLRIDKRAEDGLGVLSVVDFKVKSLLTTDPETKRAMERASNAAPRDLGSQGNPIQTPISRCHAMIAASLDVKYNLTRVDYRHVRPHVEVEPMVISTGGTYHKSFYNFIKTVINDPEDRHNYYLNTSVILARVRGTAYSQFFV